jgi:hypothetical protein
LFSQFAFLDVGFLIFILQIEFAMTVSEIDLAAGLEAATVMNSFALSCPIPVPIVGAPNVTKSVEVSLAAYRFALLIFIPLLLAPHLIPAVGASTWTKLRRLFLPSAFEQLSPTPPHFRSKICSSSSS